MYYSMEQTMSFLKGLKVKHTVKQFYRTFSYRICFKIDESLLVYSQTRSSWYGRHPQSNLTQLRKDLRYKIIDQLPDDLECKLRSEGRYVTMYLNDEAVFEDLVTRLKPSIFDVSVPLNDSHKQIMEENHRIRVRKKLFHNKFRFKVNIKSSWNDKFAEFENLHAWLHNLDDESGIRWAPNNPLKKVFRIIDSRGKYNETRYYWHNYAVYLNDDQDVMMLQMWLHNYYDSAEKAVLISEL